MRKEKRRKQMPIVEGLTIRDFAKKFEYPMSIIIQNLMKKKKKKKQHKNQEVDPSYILKGSDYFMIRDLISDIKAAYLRKNKVAIQLPKAHFRKLKNNRPKSRGVYDKVVKFGGTGKLILTPM